MSTATQKFQRIERLAKRMRYDILRSTTAAGSGHPSSSLSATDLIAMLCFGGFFKYDIKHPQYQNNDPLIFSKGHASPLLYALYAAAGTIKEKEVLSLRKFTSRLEGHPSMLFPYTEAPTGSLGQGLSVGVGMALHAKYVAQLSYTTYVLLGDSEMTEGQIWEAVQLAAYYKLNNLVAIIDVNRFGQRGETMYGHNLSQYKKRLGAMGWQTTTIDGHSMSEIHRALTASQKVSKPFAIIAKTIKGKGVSFMENKNGWHGKTLSEEEFKRACVELGNIPNIVGTFRKPKQVKSKTVSKQGVKKISYKRGDPVAPRTGYGNALARLASRYPNLLVLDAEVSNSTKTEFFKKQYPKRFFEMFIAEQNMASAGLGLALRGNTVSINSFAAFLTRAYDQIRMNQYTDAHLIYGGSHAGVSIGPDGFSQMGLQDIAFFRSLHSMNVLYPADAISAEQCVACSLAHPGQYYIRTTRGKLPVLYKNNERFSIGGSKTLRRNKKDCVTIVAAGITLHEVLKAHDELKKQKIYTRVIDLYSIKPIDSKTLKQTARDTKGILTVEDHAPEGGLGAAVRDTLSTTKTFIRSLAVARTPHSGTPQQLLRHQHIDSEAIVREVKKMLQR